MRKLWRIVFALSLVAAAFALRAPYFGRKIFNTDEGSTFTFAQQILAGDVMYRDSADIRFPLVPYLKAAVLAVAGDWNTTAVRAVWAVMLGLCAVGVWRIARRLGDETAGLAAAMCFTVLSFALLEHMEGFALHTEWFLIAFSIGGFLAFARAAARPGILGGLGVGALFALATLCKQPGLLDFAVALVLTTLLFATRPGERTAWVRFGAGQLAGFAGVLAATAGYFAAHHALDDLIYYSWTYNHTMYVPAQEHGSRLAAIIVPLRLLRDQVPAALVIGGAGAGILLWQAARDFLRRPVALSLLPWLILGWSASGLAASTISGRGFSHYAIQAIPGFSLACGWAVARALDWAGRGALWRVAAVTLSLAVGAGATTWQTVRRLANFQAKDDFTPVHAKVVDAFTRRDERVFVWGFFPEFYAFTERLPATKFVCPNFLTGQIPWTNLDSLIDTSYAIVPHADEQFAAELRRQPPALVVDIGQMRGYLKYPILRQPVLGAELIAHYALVRPASGDPLGFTYYRRTTGATGNALPAAVATDAGVRLTPLLPPDEHPVARLRVNALAGVNRVELFRDGNLFRQLDVPAAFACDVDFLVATADTNARFRAVVHRGTALAASSEVDLGAFLAVAARAVPSGPPLHFAGVDHPPVAAGSYHEAIRRLPDKDRWLAHAPSFLRYERPAGMNLLRLEYGLDEEVYFETKHHGASNGIDVVADFIYRSDGHTERLFARRLNPAGYGSDQGTQKTEVKLPGDAPGTIVLRMLPGPNSDPGFDWAYWSRISGSLPQPRLAFGATAINASESSGAGQSTLADLRDDRWLLHPPGRLVFPAAAAMRTLEFDYGLEPPTYDGTGAGKTDGVTFHVLLERNGAAPEEIFTRTLDPVRRADDRGTLHAKIALPTRAFARVVITTDAGPRNDPGYDWSWIGRLRATAE